MTKRMIRGVFAAVLTPRDRNGSLNEAALEHLLEFLLGHGIRNFAFNGATAEYCLNSQEEVKRSLAVANSVLPADATFLCGVGSAGLRGTLALGETAMEAGAKALLVPMPYFFPYEQDDLSAFVRTVAAQLPTPLLLYNLPFSSGLELATVRSLLEECGNIIGIKDSSGTLTILRALTEEGIDSSRILGNDGLLAQAITEGTCDATVSGVACVMPELIHALFTHPPASAEFHSAGQKLQEFIAQIDVLPVPWGLKAIAEARGMVGTTYQQPVSPRRAKQIHDIQAWFDEEIEQEARGTRR